MSTPRWGHKPPPVADRYRYGGSPPPSPSERAIYWVRRWREASWEPNRWLLRECADCRAGMLGVWVWEARFVLHPLTELRAGVPEADIAARVAEWSDVLPGPYWALLEERSRPGHWDLDGPGDLVTCLAEAMQQAVRRPLTARDVLTGRRR